MGDHRLPGSQARRTLKPTSQGASAKSSWKDSSKCFSKHKKEQLRFPTSMENQHRLYGKERSDDFRKSRTWSEGLTPRSMEGTVFPTIARGVCSPIANKNQQKSADDSGLLYPLLTVQPTHRTFWDDIGSRHQQLLAPWPRGEDSSADILIKMLETPKSKRMLETKWPYWEDHREATKQPTTSAKQSQGKFDLDHHKLPWSCEGTWLHDGKHRGQDMLSSIYYKYIYKGGNDEWAETYRDSIHHFDTGYDNQSSCEESSVRRTDLCNFDIKYGRKASKEKDTPLSKQESSFVIKLQTPPDLYRPNKYTRYESPFLKANQLKTIGEETAPNELELQGENPETTEQAYDPTDWKYFISKDDTTPSTLEQMFMKKRWGCECTSPTSKMFRDYYWIVDSDDDDDDDDDEEEEEEEKLKEQQTENK
ncbi:protein FAM47E-like [Grammomys surdaster]|uniref:protein FAM47E-like n=1 Tax=Grammomys surdaster TaxID=491861 RepID=UPI0010A03AA9|nr:protein FAM47E-like [Grammomys surdaster]